MKYSVIKPCFGLISSLINIYGFQLQIRKCTLIHLELCVTFPIHAAPPCSLIQLQNGAFPLSAGILSGGHFLIIKAAQKPECGAVN